MSGCNRSVPAFFLSKMQRLAAERASIKFEQVDEMGYTHFVKQENIYHRGFFSSSHTKDGSSIFDRFSDG